MNSDGGGAEGADTLRCVLRTCPQLKDALAPFDGSFTSLGFCLAFSNILQIFWVLVDGSPGSVERDRQIVIDVPDWLHKESNNPENHPVGWDLSW